MKPVVTVLFLSPKPSLHELIDFIQRRGGKKRASDDEVWKINPEKNCLFTIYVNSGNSDEWDEEDILKYTKITGGRLHPWLLISLVIHKGQGHFAFEFFEQLYSRWPCYIEHFEEPYHCPQDGALLKESFDY